MERETGPSELPHGEGVHQNLHVHMVRPSTDEGEEFLHRYQREAQLAVAADFDKRQQACAHSLSSTVSEVDGNFSGTSFQAGANSVAPRLHDPPLRLWRSARHECGHRSKLIAQSLRSRVARRLLFVGLQI